MRGGGESAGAERTEWACELGAASVHMHQYCMLIRLRTRDGTLVRSLHTPQVPADAAAAEAAAAEAAFQALLPSGAVEIADGVFAA